MKTQESRIGHSIVAAVIAIMMLMLGLSQSAIANEQDTDALEVVLQVQNMT